MCLETSIKQDLYKSEKSIVIENDILKVIVLPRLGGKIVSFYNKKKEFELLYQNKSNHYGKAQIYDSFSEYDASGFDDAFPNIDEEDVLVESSIIKYPDHGEIWSAACNYKIKNNNIILNYESEILKYSYKKVISLVNSELLISYEITNFGDKTFPYIWTMHCLNRYEEDMEFIFPKGVDKILNVQDGTPLGPSNVLHNFPISKDINGDEFNFKYVNKFTEGKSAKYYVDREIQEGVCGVDYPTQDTKYRVRFDENILPYLGLWITQGGFRGDYNYAFEPSSGYYDSIGRAIGNRAINYMSPNDKLQFEIQIELS